MPGETITTGDAAAVFGLQKAQQKYPQYKIVLVSKSHRSQLGFISQVDHFRSMGYIVLEEEDQDLTGHPDMVLMGIDHEKYAARKRKSLEEANDFGRSRPENWDEMEITSGKAISHKEAIDSLPDAPEGGPAPEE